MKDKGTMIVLLLSITITVILVITILTMPREQTRNITADRKRKRVHEAMRKNQRSSYTEKTRGVTDPTIEECDAACNELAGRIATEQSYANYDICDYSHCRMMEANFNKCHPDCSIINPSPCTDELDYAEAIQHECAAIMPGDVDYAKCASACADLVKWGGTANDKNACIVKPGFCASLYEDVCYPCDYANIKDCDEDALLKLVNACDNGTDVELVPFGQQQCFDLTVDSKENRQTSKSFLANSITLGLYTWALADVVPSTLKMFGMDGTITIQSGIINNIACKLSIRENGACSASGTTGLLSVPQSSPLILPLIMNNLVFGDQYNVTGVRGYSVFTVYKEITSAQYKAGLTMPSGFVWYKASFNGISAPSDVLITACIVYVDGNKNYFAIEIVSANTAFANINVIELTAVGSNPTTAAAVGGDTMHKQSSMLKKFVSTL